MRVWTGIFMIVALLGWSMPASASGPEGLWQVRDGRGKVKVGPCEQAPDQLCGKIVWVGPGEPKIDGNNNKIMGMAVAWGMQQTASNQWTGRVYDPEKGKSYKGYMSLLTGGRMKVTGCLTSFLCQSKYWTRLSN